MNPFGPHPRAHSAFLAEPVRGADAPRPGTQSASAESPRRDAPGGLRAVPGGRERPAHDSAATASGADTPDSDSQLRERAGQRRVTRTLLKPHAPLFALILRASDPVVALVVGLI